MPELAAHSRNLKESPSFCFDKLVERCRQGCRDAESQLAEHVHEEFYRIACRLCYGSQFEHSMHATNLVNETFLRLLKAGRFGECESKAHFYSAAGKTMRCIIADYLRSRRAQKRPTSRSRSFLEDVVDQLESQPFDFEALNEALHALERQNKRHAQIVEMRYFLGMTISETAEALDVSESTVEKSWRQARLSLFKSLT